MLDQFSSLIAQFGIWQAVGAVLATRFGCKLIDVLIDEGFCPYLRLWHVQRTRRVSEEPKPPIELVLARVLPPGDTKPLSGILKLIKGLLK